MKGLRVARTGLAATIAGLVLCAAGSVASAAQTYSVTWDGTLDTVFYPFMDQPASAWEYLGDYGGMVLPNFTADFSSDKTFVINFSAPAGKKIVVTKPAAADWISFELELATSDQLNYPVESGTMDSLVFEGAVGTPPSLWSEGSIDSNAEQVLWIGPKSNGVSDSFSFTGITMSFTLPSSLTTSFVDRSWDLDTVAFKATGAGLVDDPGQWLTLEPVPEPATMALLGMGAVVLGLRRQRRK